ncbi:urease accessory protein UreD [Oharaeibacter diazotrophicus]|uniref:urease accessory protein UreD n=2 Tax=Oharaeibacter diazotrophicus TaxID=1920512 RepID=UPI001FE022AF|nr:urease accessory protein UreD [Oharaeibacter diazotrophicus]
MAMENGASAARMQRARGSARVSFRHDPTAPSAATRLAELWQDGSGKIRLPNVHDGRGPVAVLLNTAGGVTGGDRLDYAATWGAGTTATVTSQAAERVYRRSAGTARVDTTLTLGAGARGAWLPQETILFDRSALSRNLTVEMADDASLVACETVLFGRTAMGEEVTDVELDDLWRIRRGGRLVYADRLRIHGDAKAILSGGATGRGARAIAGVVAAAPDAEARLDGAREILGDGADGVEAGASAFDGLLVLRLAAPDGRALRRRLEPLLAFLIDGPLPRVWAL